MNKDTLLQPFRWAVGFEGSFIPHLNIDQYHWTQHDRFWRSDFERVAHELGCKWMRYPLPWHQIETTPGHFDWRETDERFERAEALGLNMIVGLVHFGTPTWLPHALGDIEFPAALERFSRALARRYGKALRHVCPVNEPMISALFSGDFGLWPPHGRGLSDFMAVSMRIAHAMQRSIAALREELSDVEIWVNDSVEVPTTTEDDWHAEVLHRLQRRHLNLDLALGRVDEPHPLYGWVREHGAGRFDLEGLVRGAPVVDVLGLDYYSHCEFELASGGSGLISQKDVHCPRGLFRVAQDYWQRYNIPLAITETSAPGCEHTRGDWLEWTVFETRRLRESGVPVVSYTWWPVIDHLDWDGALRHQTGHIHHAGLFNLHRDEHGRLIRSSTTMSAAYAELIRRGDDAVGRFTPAPSSQQIKSAAPQGTAFKESMNISPSARGGFTPPRPEFSLIVHSHLRWDWVWQRPQQFLSRLSEQHPVLFCEGPRLVEEDVAPYYTVHEDEKYPNVSVFLTHLPASRFSDGAWVDAQRTRLLKEALAGPLRGRYERPVQWFYDPMAVPAFLGQMGEIANVYDCMDQLSQFRFAPPELISRERQLLEHADVVFAGGYKMWEDKKRHNANAHFYGCGVDVDHFATARAEETAIPTDIDFVSRPILGYFGVVDERLDYDLILRLAESNPGWNVCIVGPPCKIDPNSLPRRANIFWLGGRPYADLPAYAKAFDVCLMPFALNEATEFINPTKTLEYMAMGKPVVSTAVPDVVTNFGRHVAVAKDADEFISLCEKALQNPDCDQVKRGIEMANRNTWEYIVGRLERHIEEAIEARTEAGRAAQHRKAAEHKPLPRQGAMNRRSGVRV